MSITASPRLYWLRKPSNEPPLVEVITETGRHPLALYPFGLSPEEAAFIWGEKGPGTKHLARAILWDVFKSREVVEQFYRKFSDDVIEDVRASVANVVPLGLVLEWFREECEGRARIDARRSNCGGCGE